MPMEAEVFGRLFMLCRNLLTLVTTILVALCTGLTMQALL